MKRLVGLVVLSSVLGCNGGPNKTNIELIQNMMDQPSIKSQDWVPEDGDKGQMRMPPAHAVPQGYMPYMFTNDLVAAEKNPNPTLKTGSREASPESLALGHKNYEVYCTPCHGSTGAGDGLVAAKMAVKPRNLISADAKAYTDGRIYHAVTAGRGVMRPYASQIPDPVERWSIVNYVRTLQK